MSDDDIPEDDLPSTETSAMETVLSPVLAAAANVGISLRPITGNDIRRAATLGIDLDELGTDPGEGDDIPDDAYYDQVTTACWLLAADPAEIRVAMANATTEIEVEAWRDECLVSIEKEKTAIEAFMARWLEYRVEMERVFGEEEDETDAESE